MTASPPERVLGILSMLYPPDREIGALRVGKLTNTLRERHGWSLVVVKRSGEKIDSIPQQTVVSVPTMDSLAGIKWLRSRRHTKSSEAEHLPEQPVPSAAPRKRSLPARISDLLVVPDNRQTWALTAYRQMRGLIRYHRVRALFSSGPPHSAHLAAYLCKRRFRLPWVLDLRDPWCENPYEQPLSDIAQHWNHFLERRCFHRADVILANTEPARQLILRRYPDMVQSKVVTFPNGIDVEDYSGLVPQPFWERTDRPVLIHAGSLYAKRDPRPLFRALANLKKQGVKIPKILFVGTVDARVDANIREVRTDEQLDADIDLLPPISRIDCLQGMLAADGLLLIGDAELVQLQIPAKLFEYLYLQKPILSLFPSSSPVNRYLEDYAPFAVSAAPSEVNEIGNAVSTLMNHLQRRHSSFAKRSLQELLRSCQADKLNDILGRLMADSKFAF